MTYTWTELPTESDEKIFNVSAVFFERSSCGLTKLLQFRDGSDVFATLVVHDERNLLTIEKEAINRGLLYDCILRATFSLLGFFIRTTETGLPIPSS